MTHGEAVVYVALGFGLCVSLVVAAFVIAQVKR